jgi:hypothetical protein
MPDDYPGYPEFSPQELNLYWHHLSNLYGPGKQVTPQGDIMTAYQATVGGPGGQYYAIPTVWGGQTLTTDEARQRAGQLGWNTWPSYSTPERADQRYGLLHQYMDQDTARYIASHGPQGLLGGFGERTGD